MGGFGVGVLRRDFGVERFESERLEIWRGLSCIGVLTEAWWEEEVE